MLRDFAQVHHDFRLVAQVYLVVSKKSNYDPILVFPNPVYSGDVLKLIDISILYTDFPSFNKILLIFHFMELPDLAQVLQFLKVMKNLSKD